jgi:hypothetical protein
MEEQLIQAFVTAEHTCFVTCPKCKAQKLLRLRELPPDSPNPLPYTCPCGAALKVTLNFRKSARKPVKLMGTFKVPSEPKQIERICEILDISDQGMRIAADFFKTISEGQLIHARILLDDPRRTKLDLPCLVRNLTRDNVRLLIGVHFENLDEAQKQALGFYMMSLKG